MPTFNLLIYLNAYSDAQSSNNPSQNNFKWTNNINGLAVDKPVSSEFSLAPGETKSLFSGIRTLTQDGTTAYDIALKPLTSSTYVLTNSAGLAPNFRTPRSLGSDATTQVTVTLNGPLAIFTSTGGTPFLLTPVVVGDNVFIGSAFNSANQGFFKVLSKTATSFTVENESAVAEGPITLGATFAKQVEIFSAAGVQVGDTLVISSGFSPVTQGNYKITAVHAEYLEFSSLDVLPSESAILTQVSIYSDSKQLIYLESDQKVGLTINGIDGGTVEPFITSAGSEPGLFLRKSTIYSLSVTNNGQKPASLFFAAIG